jgi:DNA-binding SARP family transcriptional activator
VEFRILGPLEVVEDGEPVALGNLKERLVLGVLLLHANEFVSRERLIDDLWGEAPPATARQAISVYVSKLRKTLGRPGADPIATADGGYRLHVEPERLDVRRMHDLVARARELVAKGELEGAANGFQEAISLWRGPTLAGFQLESRGRDEVAQLDELRLAVLMDRIDCDLAVGRHERVLGELQVLVEEHPLRERLRAQQMLALYRADRQVDALDAYQRARHALIDELGVEPSESLQRLQQAILQHDPALELPAGTTAANGAAVAAVTPQDVVPPSAAARSRPRRPALRRRHLVVAGLAAVAVSAAVVAFLTTRGSGLEPASSPVSSVSPNTIAFLDPDTGAQVGDSGGPNMGEPGPMALDGNILWVVARGSGTLLRYDVRDQPGAPFLPAGASPYAVAAAGGYAWVSQRKPVVIWIRHVGSAPSMIRQSIRVRQLKKAGAEAVGGGYLWVIPGPVGTGNRVARINLRNPQAQSTVGLGLQTTAIAFGYGSAWVGTYDPRHGGVTYLTRVGPGSDQPLSVQLETQDGAGPLAVAVGAGSVWVISAHGNLIGVDPKTELITHKIPMAAEQPEEVAVGASAVWTANPKSFSVSKIDPHTNKIVFTTPALGRWDAVPCGIAATHARVFVAFGETGCG